MVAAYTVVAGCSSDGTSSGDTSDPNEKEATATTLSDAETDESTIETDEKEVTATTLSSKATDETTATTPTDSNTPAKSTVTTGTNTTQTDYYGSAGFDIGVYNDDTKKHQVAVVVEKELDSGNKGEPVFEHTFDVSSGTQATRDIQFTEPGTYRIEARLKDGPSATYEWKLSDIEQADPMAIFVDITSEGGVGFTEYHT
jgi:hypothetical protein